jgi:hypothetical protein
MNLIKYFDLFLGSLISVIANTFIIIKLYKIKVDKNKLYLLIIATIVVSIINIYNRDLFKVFLIVPILSICFKYLFNIEIRKSLSYVILSVFYLFIGEIITGVIFSLLPLNYTFIYNNILGGTIGSLSVIIFSIPFVFIENYQKF